MKYKSKSIAFIILIMIASISIKLLISYSEIQEEAVYISEYVETINQSKWGYIRLLILENYDKAQNQSDDIKTAITRDVQDTYGDDEDWLKRDLDNISSPDDSSLVDIVARNLEGIYLNNIKNDHNDPFASTNNSIISDLSFNCAAYGRTRTFEEEISMHFNQYLAKIALENISNKGVGKTFWHFLPVNNSVIWYDDVRLIKNMDIDIIKDIFMKYDANTEVLNGFEFIATSYIQDTTDLTGQRIIGFDGVRTGNNQIMINSGFSISDIINNNSDYRSDIEEFDNKKEIVIRDHRFYMQRKGIMISVEILVFLITFIALGDIQQTILKNREGEKEGGTE